MERDDLRHQVSWLDLFGWTEDDLNGLRFVAYSYIQQRHYEIALKIFEALVVLSPSSSYDLQTLGALYLEIGDNLKALTYLDRALVYEPEHGVTLLNQAKALILLGYYKQGLRQMAVLKGHSDAIISRQAEALLMAYQ